MSSGHEDFIRESRTYKREQIIQILGIQEDVITILQTLYGLLPLGSPKTGFVYSGRNVIEAMANQATNRITTRQRPLTKSAQIELIKKLKKDGKSMDLPG